MYFPAASGAERREVAFDSAKLTGSFKVAWIDIDRGKLLKEETALNGGMLLTPVEGNVVAVLLAE